MTFKIELQTVDGESAGTFATNLSDWFTGMEFRGEGNQLMRIVAVNAEGGAQSDDGLALDLGRQKD